MRILITGKHSYIGNSVKVWINEKEPTFLVDELSLKNIDLNSVKFNNYDVVFHVAGIAHISSKKGLIKEYFKVNRDLAIEVANRAKQAGVKQFLFISTMAIYGDDRPIGDYKSINIHSPSPKNAYGQSKFQADLAIQKLNDKNFKVSILRIPMIYGKDAKGNFNKLFKFSKKLFILPKIYNIRSVLHIKNLSEIVRIIIKNKLEGVFYPQDRNYFVTNDFIIKVRFSGFKKTILIPYLSILIKILVLLKIPINKIYGNKYYDFSISSILPFNYQLFTIDDFINENNK